MDKVLGWIGFDVVEQEEPEEQEKREKWSVKDRSQVSGNSHNVVSLHNARPVKFVVVRPKSYEHVQKIADHLKNRRPIVLNLEEAEKETAKRILDFVSGTAYALNGNMQKISTGIFLFVPSNIEVMGDFGDLNEALNGRSIFKWDQASGSKEGQERR